jgi:hypothetical protein
LKLLEQEYTAECKGLAVKRGKTGRDTGAAAGELSLVKSALRNCGKAVDARKLVVRLANLQPETATVHARRRLAHDIHGALDQYSA